MKNRQNRHLEFIAATALVTFLGLDPVSSAASVHSIRKPVTHTSIISRPMPSPLNSIAHKRVDVLLNGRLVLQTTSVVESGTTYMSLTDLQTLLSCIGVDDNRTASAWDFKTPNRSIPFITKSNVSKLQIRRKYTLNINQQTSIHLPELLVENSDSKSATTTSTPYEPIYAVMQGLKYIGFQSQWDGSHWNLSGIVVYGRRKFPYPYQAMLSLASDADHETLRKFNLVHQFLNTTGDTPGGPGLGLDIADSFFMYNGSDLQSNTDVNNLPLSDELSYFRGTTDEPYAANVINQYIHEGWLDSIHTFGDFSVQDVTHSPFTRQLAIQAIQALQENHDAVSVWIDHGNRGNVDNFGSYGLDPFYDYQKGANPSETAVYHTDLTVPYGVHFVWADRPSDQFGMDSVLYPITLPDAQRVWGFWRFTNDTWGPGGSPQWLWSADNLYQQLSPLHLSDIVKNHQYAVVAQHFSADNTTFPFTGLDVTALRNLASAYENGDILVTRTSRLLRYNVADDYLQYQVTKNSDGNAVINLLSIDDPMFGSYKPTIDDVRGMTFYTSDATHTDIQIDGVDVPETELQRNPNDGVAQSVGIRWFSEDTTDYSVQPAGIY